MDFDYSKAIKSLEKRFNFEKKESINFSFFKLDRSFQLMKLLDSPHKSDALTIHIAGTNGKGSVSSLLSSILSLKYKVGLYTSPHLNDYTERIKINKKDIPMEEFADIYFQIEKKISDYEKKISKQFSFFEILTAISFIYFKKNSVNINVIETGIGGTFDTTNVLASDIQVITPISYDHQNVLGNTIKLISENKAGIIKKNSVVITAHQENEAFEIIKEKAKKEKSKLISLNYSIDAKPSVKGNKMNSVIGINNEKYAVSTRSIGKYYLDNIALSIQTLNHLNKYNVNKVDIENGIKENFWPCRGNLEKHKDRIFFIDGAHNEEGFRKLKSTINEFFDKKFIFIFGLNKNHDIGDAIKFIKEFKCKTIISESNHPKSEKIEYIEKKFKYNNINYIKSNTMKDALNISLRESKDNEIIVSAGSLFISAEIKKLIENEQRK